MTTAQIYNIDVIYIYFFVAEVEAGLSLNREVSHAQDLPRMQK